jgi:hypothetical protein
MALAKRVKHITHDGGEKFLPQKLKQLGVIIPFHASSLATADTVSCCSRLNPAFHARMAPDGPEASQHIETRLPVKPLQQGEPEAVPGARVPPPSQYHFYWWRIPPWQRMMGVSVIQRLNHQ